jgi:hypothetical protein
MPPPNDYTLPNGIEAYSLPKGSLSLSDALVELLVTAHSSVVADGENLKDSLKCGCKAALSVKLNCTGMKPTESAKGK